MMKIKSYSCCDGYDRPDYETLARASGKSKANRVAIAHALILDGHTSVRAFDNCFENGDGDKVIAALVKRSSECPELAAFLKSAITYSTTPPTTWMEYGAATA